MLRQVNLQGRELRAAEKQTQILNPGLAEREWGVA